MGRSAFEAVPRALDANGNPVNGARLYVYEAGTTTDKTVYSDEDMTAAHAQPIVANAAGFFAQIYAPAGDYKYVIKDAADATITEADNVNQPDTTSDVRNLAMLSDAFTNGGTFRLTTDLTVASTLTFSGTDSKHLRLDLNGHTLTSALGGNPVIRATNSAKESPVAVSAVATVARDYSQGAAITTDVSRLTAAGHSCVRGDIIKVYDDTLLPQQHDANERQGEYAIVAEVDDEDIYLTGTLIETYTPASNMKIVRPSRSRLHITNGTLVNTATADDAAGIIAEGFLEPVLENISTQRFTGAGITLTGCYMPVVRSYRMQDHENGDEDGIGTAAFGYGVVDISSFGGVYTGLQGSKGRHLFDTGTNATTAGDDEWRKRGRTMFPTVSDSIGFGFGAAIFDTHPSAFATTFQGCTAIGAYRGFSSGGEGFQLRGPQASIVGCKSVNCRYGILITRDSDEDYPSHNFISDFVSDGDEAVFNITGETGAGGTAVLEIPSITARNVTADVFVATEYADISIGRLRAVFASDALAFSEVFDLDNDATVTVQDLHMDVSATGQTDHRIGQIRGSNCSIKAKANIVQGNTDKLSSYVDAGSNVATVHLDVSKDSNQVEVVSNAAAGSDVRLITREEGSSSQNYSGLRFLTLATAGPHTLNTGDAADPEVFVRVEVTGAAATIDTLPDGKFGGQVLTIWNRDTSAANLNVDDQAGPSVALAASDKLRMVWDLSQWVPV